MTRWNSVDRTIAWLILFVLVWTVAGVIKLWTVDSRLRRIEEVFWHSASRDVDRDLELMELRRELEDRVLWRFPPKREGGEEER